MPCLLLRRSWHLFRLRLRDAQASSPSSWKFIGFIGLAKTTKPEKFADFRWIGKLDCCFKWYARSLKPLIRPALKTTTVATFGFCANHCCDDVTALLRQIIFLVSRWSLSLVIGALDVETAFDSMHHGSLEKSFIIRGCHPSLVRALLQEVSFMRCRMSLSGMLSSE